MYRYSPPEVAPKKRFGQNFLVDSEVATDLVDAADLTKDDVVIEVGAGTGVLTKELAKKAGKVVAFELDHDLIPVLEKELAGFDNIEVINQDFLKLDDSLILHSTEELPRFKVVGSIPYQITSPLIHKLLILDPKPTLIVLLIQKEVAEKITAEPPKATYLSNIVKLLGEVGIVRLVSKTAFWPIPEVDGAVVKLVPNAQCLVPRAEIDEFQQFLHCGFQNPRKMLRTKFDVGILEKCGIGPTRRAQHLEFHDWSELYEMVKQVS